MRTHFILRGKSENKKTIYIKISQGAGCSRIISTHCQVNPKDWDVNKERLPKDYYNKTFIKTNNKLDALQKAIFSYHDDSVLDNHYVTITELCNYATGYINPKKNQKNSKSDFLDFMDTYIKDAKTRPSLSTGKPLTIDTINKFKNFKEKFIDFCKYENKWYDFDNIDIRFYNKFNFFLQEKCKFKINTIGKYIRTLKTILSDAEANDWQVNPAYKSKKFAAHSEEIDSVYLNFDELDKIKQIKLNDFDDKVRILFLIGCYTGLRFSDYSRLTLYNIENGLINISQQKTGKKGFYSNIIIC